MASDTKQFLKKRKDLCWKCQLLALKGPSYVPLNVDGRVEQRFGQHNMTGYLIDTKLNSYYWETKERCEGEYADDSKDYPIYKGYTIRPDEDGVYMGEQCIKRKGHGAYLKRGLFFDDVQHGNWTDDSNFSKDEEEYIGKMLSKLGVLPEFIDSIGCVKCTSVALRNLSHQCNGSLVGVDARDARVFYGCPDDIGIQVSGGQVYFGEWKGGQPDGHGLRFDLKDKKIIGHGLWEEGSLLKSQNEIEDPFAVISLSLAEFQQLLTRYEGYYKKYQTFVQKNFQQKAGDIQFAEVYLKDGSLFVGRGKRSLTGSFQKEGKGCILKEKYSLLLNFDNNKRKGDVVIFDRTGKILSAGFYADEKSFFDDDYAVERVLNQFGISQSDLTELHEVAQNRGHVLTWMRGLLSLNRRGCPPGAFHSGGARLFRWPYDACGCLFFNQKTHISRGPLLLKDQKSGLPVLKFRSTYENGADFVDVLTISGNKNERTVSLANDVMIGHTRMDLEMFTYKNEFKFNKPSLGNRISSWVDAERNFSDKIGEDSATDPWNWLAWFGIAALS